MNELILSFHGVTVRTFNQILLHDLDFSIRKGELWAVVGPGGSGKSAFLSAIAGKFNISGGTVQHPYFDRYIENPVEGEALMSWHKFVGLISSRHHFKNLSNTSNFYYQQRFNSADSEDAATVSQYLSSLSVVPPQCIWTYEKVVKRLRLQSLLDKQLIKLSNGETKRLLLAAALIRNPFLLLLDNPLTGLDKNSREGFDQLIDEIASSGISIIMATSPFDIPKPVTHVAMLEGGTIVKTMAASKFNREEYILADTVSINAYALKELLSGYEGQAYDKVVEMKDVVVRYGGKTILEGVNWTVRQGERWALLGHNGAGKSTLLSLINADNPQAYANSIVLFDRKRGSGESIWDIKKKIGFVSPELFQYFPSTNNCLQVIESGFYDTLGLFRPSSESKSEIALKWMKLLEIESNANKLFKQASASVQRLCLLSRALVKSPALLIFDEPCQGLDLHQQSHFRRITDEICESSNVTLIYVSHYQHEIPASVTKILRLEMGRVVE